MKLRVIEASRAMLARLAPEAGQATTESAIILSGLLLATAFPLVKWAPDMLEALTIYVRGFYVVLGYPIG